MNIVKKLMAGAAAMSLVAMPVAASATDASKLSLTSSSRAGTSAKAKNELGGGGGFFVAIIAAIAVIAGIIIVANEDDSPNSN